jgi:hypothetical protein
VIVAQIIQVIPRNAIVRVGEINSPYDEIAAANLNEKSVGDDAPWKL